MKYLYFDYNSDGYILHGSPNQNLKLINSKKSQYNNKVFGTYSFERALRYTASLENGGNGSFGFDGKRIILNANPGKLLLENGSIYILSCNGFIPDDHKGKQHDWIYSTMEECEVIAEIKIINILKTWNNFGIYAADKNDTDELLKQSDPRDIINKIINKNEVLSKIYF